VAKVKVRLFARLGDIAGARETQVEMSEGLRAIDVYRLLCERYPGMGGLNGSLMYAVNAEYVDAETPLKEGDELALIPPVSGGAASEPTVAALAQGLLVGVATTGAAVVITLLGLADYERIANNVYDPGESEVPLRSLSLALFFGILCIPVFVTYSLHRLLGVNIIAVVTAVALLVALLVPGLFLLSWETGCLTGNGFPIPGVAEDCGR